MSINIPKSEVCKLEDFAYNENKEICDISTTNIKTESPSIIINGKNTILVDTQFAESLANIKEELDYVDDKVFVSRTIVNVNGNEFKDDIKDEIIRTNDINFEETVFYIQHLKAKKKLSNKRNRRQRQIYKCSQCKYKTMYKGDLKDHANKHYIVKVFKCKTCCRRFSCIDNLKLHVTNVHTDTDGRKTSNIKRHLSRNEEKKTFKRSTRISLKKRFKCFKCDYVTKHKTNLNRHSNTHLTVRRFKCTHCDYVTHSKQYLRKHTDVHEKNKRLKCDQCDYVTNRMYNFKRHCDMHRTVKQFGCLKCDYVTHLKYMFEEHVSNHDTVKRLKCSQCDYTTCEKRLLTAHSYIHMEVRQYVCSQCDYVTNNKYYLKAHSYKHESEKRFKCLKCDYATHINHSFKEHANKHEPDKRLKCPECDYVTNQERYLRMHCYRHRGVKRFECSKCKFKTNYKWYLRGHVCKSSAKPG